MTAFRVGFVPGVMPDKWKRIWAERRQRPLELVMIDEAHQEEAIRSGEVDMCLVRGSIGREGMHLIPLYDEEQVIVVSREHPAAAYDELDPGELADEVDVLAAYPQLTVRDAIATVAAGTGYVVVPRSVSRVNRRKDVAVVAALGCDEIPVGLAWLVDSSDIKHRDEDDVQAFVGIVRGRTARSSR